MLEADPAKIKTFGRVGLNRLTEVSLEPSQDAKSLRTETQEFMVGEIFPIQYDTEKKTVD
jgi:hypothetical protein